MPPEIAIFFIFVVAMFVQTSTGFGSALIAMSFLIGMLGPDIAAPLFALSFSTVSIVITYRYRHDLKIRNIWRIMLAGIVGVPIGVGVISQWDKAIVLFIFGMFISGYALYALLGFKAPRFKHPALQWVVGLLAGMASGAYNTSGPVYIVYGDTQRWQPFEFKGNLQVMFFFNSLFTTINHFLFGNMTQAVFGYWLYAIPGIVIGIALGFTMDRFIKPDPFRKVVQVLLFFIGISLMLP